MTEIVYGATRSPLIAGRRFFNATFFQKPDPSVTKVYLLGEHPKIRDAYERLGVPVERLDADNPPPPTARPPVALAGRIEQAFRPADERALVYIPDDWRSLPYSRPSPDRDLTLRGLAAPLSDEPITSRAQAEEVIEAELKRRDGAGE